MRNILAHVPQKEKDAFAAQLKEIWLAPSAELASQRAEQLSNLTVYIRYSKLKHIKVEFWHFFIIVNGLA